MKIDISKNLGLEVIFVGLRDLIILVLLPYINYLYIYQMFNIIIKDTTKLIFLESIASFQVK